MDQVIEKEVPLADVSVLIGVSKWMDPEAWVCPEDSYVVCQRLSEGHSPLRISDENVTRDVYPQVRTLGFMPSTRSIMMYPLELPLRTLNCFFSRAFFEETTEIDVAGWHQRAGSFMVLSNRPVESLMWTIHREMLQPGFGAEQMIEAASTMIAVEMARLGRDRADPAVVLGHGNQGLAPWQMRRIRERLDAAAELGYPSIAELSKLCGISRSHLMRMFKASTGRTLQQFITAERLNSARHMLADDRLSIKEIAGMLGFCNTAHFSNAFRRAEALAPSDFRRRSRTGALAMTTASSRGSAGLH